MAKQISFISYSGSEVALYSGDYTLIYNTNDYWECSYTEYSEGRTNYAGYSLNLEGLWLDNEMIITEKITVVRMYAQTFDAEGRVSSGSGTHLDDIVFTSDYKNNKNLPYFKYGHIQPPNNRLLDKDAAVCASWSMSWRNRAGLA